VLRRIFGPEIEKVYDGYGAKESCMRDIGLEKVA
jgi:hypothetical protein